MEFDLMGSVLSQAWGHVNTLKNDINVLWSVMILLLFYGRAREINARHETKGEIDISAREHKRIKQKTKEIAVGIEDDLWHGLDAFKAKMYESNHRNIQIHYGNHDVGGVPVSDLKRDYHQAIGKEMPLFIDRILDWIGDSAYWVNRSPEADFRTISNMAVEERRTLMSSIHKRAGYCKEIVEMESYVLPVESLEKRLLEIVQYADSCRLVRRKEEKELLKRHDISIFNVLKIGKIVFWKGK